MCYKYPGPKCGRHVKNDLEKLTVKTKFLKDNIAIARLEKDEAEEAINTSSHMDDLAAKKLAFKKAKAKLTREEAKYTRHVSKVGIKKQEYGLTLDGMEELRQEIEDHKDLGGNVEILEERLRIAKSWYDTQVLRYDKENKTVNCLPPAKNYSADDEGKLTDEINACHKNIQGFHERMLTNNDKSVDTVMREKIAREEQKIEALRAKIAHIDATRKHIWSGILPDTNKIAELDHRIGKRADELLESYDRSDADGAGSQWASQSGMEADRLRREIAENNGKSEFVALFDLSGKFIHGKQFEDKWGKMSWGIFRDPNDSDSGFGQYVSPSSSDDPKKKEALLRKKGYTLGRILAPAYVKSTAGSGGLVSVRNIILQKHWETNEDTIEVLSYNIYAEDLVEA